ncbi:hypothetical protein DSECCO2_265500 [anaerobic digester metagenome]
MVYNVLVYNVLNFIRTPLEWVVFIIYIFVPLSLKYNKIGINNILDMVYFRT